MMARMHVSDPWPSWANDVSRPSAPAGARRHAKRLDRLLLTVVGLGALLSLVASSSSLAAVEPGIYFDPEIASVGDRITLFSAADYIVCFSPGQEEQAHEDWTVYLAPAGMSSPGADDLVTLDGTWSEQDGAVFFEFRVPSLDGGRYRGYVACADGHLDPSTTTLRIGGVPATDTASAAPTEAPGGRWVIAIATALSAFVAMLRRLEPRSGVAAVSSPHTHR